MAPHHTQGCRILSLPTLRRGRAGRASGLYLDGARRRDNGQHVDVTGGWHDAGDLRKWMDVTMLSGIELLNLMRNIPDPAPDDVSREQVLEEVRFGNTYFLKMQDTDGKVWADTAGGVNGHNFDNHCRVSWLRATRKQTTRSNASTLVWACGLRLALGRRCWNSLVGPGRLRTVSGHTGPGYRRQAALIGRDLVERQNRSFIAEQQLFRGFWMDDDPPYFIVCSSPSVSRLAGAV